MLIDPGNRISVRFCEMAGTELKNQKGVDGSAEVGQKRSIFAPRKPLGRRGGKYQHG